MQKKLNKLLKISYGKYSKISVSAIAIDKNNNEYSGVNIENASFPSSICAERSAMFSAISNGVKPGEIKQIHLTSSVDDFLYPCGGCRQVMVELLSQDAIIHIWYKNQKQSKTIDEIMPNKINKEKIKWK